MQTILSYVQVQDWKGLTRSSRSSNQDIRSNPAMLISHELYKGLPIRSSQVSSFPVSAIYLRQYHNGARSDGSFSISSTVFRVLMTLETLGLPSPIVQIRQRLRFEDLRHLFYLPLLLLECLGPRFLWLGAKALAASRRCRISSPTVKLISKRLRI